MRANGWTWRSNPKRFAVTVALALALGLLVPVGVGYVVDKAWGACVTSTQEPCPTVTPKAKRVARKYRHHKIAHASGFAPRKIFRHPLVARRVIVHKMMRAAKNYESRYGRPVPAAVIGDGVSARRSQCAADDYTCWARTYDGMVENSGCRSMADLDYGVYWDMCADDFGLALDQRLTKHQVQVGLTFSFCAVGTAAYVITSTASAGTTLFIGSTAAAACATQMWRDLSP